MANSQSHTIANLDAVYSSVLDLEQIAEAALDHMQSATGAAYLTLHADGANISFPEFAASWAGNQISHEALNALAVRNTEEARSTRQPAIYTATDDSEPGYLVALPITALGKIVGTFTLAWKEKPSAAFDLGFAQLLARSIGLALESVRSYQAQQYYIQALEYLGGLSTELNRLESAAEVTEHVEHIACVLLNVERCAVFRTQDNRIHTINASSLSVAFRDAVMGTDLGDWSLGCTTNPIETTNRVVAFANIETAPAGAREMFQREGIGAGLIAPLCGHDRMLGCVALFYDHPHTPTPYEIRLVEILAAQVGVALDNIELNTASERQAESLDLQVRERTRELAIALDKAEDADRLKTQLLSTVSHELRTPLAVIKAHIGLLRNYYDRLPKERHLEYLNTVNQETDRLAQMIDDLLNMSRIESGRLEIRKEQIEPLPLLKHLADILEKRFADRKFGWSLPETILPVTGDTERVRQVVTNLVDNAVKYSPAGTEIHVGARAWDDGLEIWVKDNGNGLTPDQIRRVFDRFFQVEDNNKNPRSGVGLGLAICKALVEEMGGRIWVESTGLNQGSRFAFTLPWLGGEAKIHGQAG